MSEPANNNQQLTTLSDALSRENIEGLIKFLQVRHDAAINDLSAITEVLSDDDAEIVNQKLVTAKKLYDMMYAKRKAFTDPVKEAITEIMKYENAINYNAKGNEYSRVRELLEAFNQKKLDEANKAKHEAWLKAEQLKYKAEYRAKVEQQLVDKLNGLHKTVIQQMVAWEEKLTLENIDTNEATLKKHQPTLKEDHYNECFRLWGARPDVLAKGEEEEYLIQLKRELPYTTYNEKFQQIVAPIKNEYLAKIPQIKENLKALAAADQKKQAELKKKLEDERQAKAQEAIKAANEAAEREAQEVADRKELNTIEADFTEQALTQDIKAPAKKLVASFQDNRLWLKPFLAAVSKVAVSQKFKGILDKSGQPKKEVQWFLDQYASLVGEPIEGLVLTEEAKTMVRSK